MGTGRLEAFSDGVIAVAITLLVLEIAVPSPRETPHLGHALWVEWPRFAAYATTFMTIGIIWINHHAMISRLRVADHSILILNLLLLMSIGILPFATNLLATYLTRPQGETVAAFVYGAAMLLMALTFAGVNRQIMLRRPHMLIEPMTPQQRRVILRHSVRGLPPYVLAMALALVSPYITLGISAALAIYYALPIASGGQAEARVSSE